MAATFVLIDGMLLLLLPHSLIIIFVIIIIIIIYLSLFYNFHYPWMRARIEFFWAFACATIDVAACCSTVFRVN